MAQASPRRRPEHHRSHPRIDTASAWSDADSPGYIGAFAFILAVILAAAYWAVRDYRQFSNLDLLSLLASILIAPLAAGLLSALLFQWRRTLTGGRRK